MKSKLLLFAGIFLLVSGIFIRKMTPYAGIGLALIITGVICKTIYIVNESRNGKYRPGKELIFLFLGLFLFLTGIYLRSQDQYLAIPTYMIVSGLVLKLIFIIRFIKIVRTLEDQ